MHSSSMTSTCFKMWSPYQGNKAIHPAIKLYAHILVMHVIKESQNPC
jgi:hypothetical protein